MKFNLVRAARFVALATVSVAATALTADAGTIYNANVADWSIGSGQSNGNFVVTTDDNFAGGALELGLRAQQRGVGGIIPSPTSSASYVALTGADPNNAARAWWNFDISAQFAGAGGVGSLDALSLYIERQAGTNGVGGNFNLLPLIGVPGFNPGPAGSLEASQNPVFGAFSPSYSLSYSGPFAYRFILSATNTEGEVTSSVSTEMCVHTEGVECVPEPSSYSLTGAMGAVLALFGYVVYTRRRYAL